ncbi:MAG: hypothetical protein WAX07_06565 [Candidatus Altiarchaeia archaeon]|jgi:hypothetical protein
MIYPTVKECLDACSKTGVLKVEGLRNDEYVLKGAGFTPRYSRGPDKLPVSRTLAKSAVFFSLVPIVILL